MKTPSENETAKRMTELCFDHGDWNTAVREDSATARGKARGVGGSPMSPVWGRDAADASHAAALPSRRGATTTPLRPRTTWVRWLALDANSSDLANFPFAFTTFMILTTGVLAIGCGITVPNVWLTVVGFLSTL